MSGVCLSGLGKYLTYATMLLIFKLRGMLILLFNFSWCRGKNFIIKFEGSFKSGSSDCFVLEHVVHDRPEVTVETIYNLHVTYLFSSGKHWLFLFKIFEHFDFKMLDLFCFRPLSILSWFAHEKSPYTFYGLCLWWS